MSSLSACAAVPAAHLSTHISSAAQTERFPLIPQWICPVYVPIHPTFAGWRDKRSSLNLECSSGGAASNNNRRITSWITRLLSPHKLKFQPGCRSDGRDEREVREGETERKSKTARLQGYIRTRVFRRTKIKKKGGEKGCLESVTPGDAWKSVECC